MLKPSSNDSTETFNAVFAFQAAEANATSHAQYDSNLNGEYGTYALLTVFMPVANSKREVSVFDATSVVTCLQVKDWNPRSRIPASRGEPTPVQMIGAGAATLSKGEMAGVVVAVVLGFVLLVAALVLWWLRHRKASRASQRLLSHSPTHEKDSQVAVATEEIGNEGARHELDPASQRLTELPDVGSNGPVELAASSTGTRHTGRLPL
jgi:hypothetical protein